MIPNSYAHPLLAMYVIKDTRQDLEQEYAMNKLKAAEKAPFVRLLVNDESGHIKQFNHPINLEYLTVVDVRPFTSVNKEGEMVIKNSSQFDMAVLRGILEYAWNHEDSRDALTSIAKVPAKLYSHWVSEAITKSLGLSIEVSGQLTMLCYYYFWSQFRDSKTGILDMDLEYPEAVKFITRNSGITAESVTRFFDVLKASEYAGEEGTIMAIRTPNEFGQMMHAIGITEITQGTLNTIMANSWQGVAAREVSILALSYPPAFYAMIITAIKDRNYRRTPLSGLLDRFRRSIDGEQFARLLRNALNSSIPEYNS